MSCDFRLLGNGGTGRISALEKKIYFKIYTRSLKYI